VEIKIGLGEQCCNFREALASKTSGTVKSLLCGERASLHPKNISSLLFATNVGIIETNHFQIVIAERRENLKGVAPSSNRHSLKDIERSADIATIDGVCEIPWGNVTRNTEIRLNVGGRHFRACPKDGFEHFQNRGQPTDVTTEMIDK
jgi:hypothetical protein